MQPFKTISLLLALCLIAGVSAALAQEPPTTEPAMPPPAPEQTIVSKALKLKMIVPAAWKLVEEPKTVDKSGASVSLHFDNIDDGGTSVQLTRWEKPVPASEKLQRIADGVAVIRKGIDRSNAEKAVDREFAVGGENGWAIESERRAGDFAEHSMNVFFVFGDHLYKFTFDASGERYDKEKVAVEKMLVNMEPAAE